MHAIARHLYDIQASTGDNFFKLFDDWLGLALAALSSAADKEDTYMAIMRKYGPRVPGKVHPADHFSKALGAFFLDCQTQSDRDKSMSDILGTIYEAESLANHHAGQFFTPEPICQMMTRMLIEPTQDPISIADPACGSGRFFIAAQPLAPHATFYGTDRDLTCVRMSALNMIVRNADAYIVHGNTLSLECFGGYRVRSSPFGAAVIPLAADTARAILVKTVDSMASPPTEESLPLFQSAPTPTKVEIDAASNEVSDRTIPDANSPAPQTEQSEPEQPPTRPAVIIDKKGQVGFGF